MTTPTIGVPYAPAIAIWLNPNPSGAGSPRKTGFVTYDINVELLELLEFGSLAYIDTYSKPKQHALTMIPKVNV
jgi:hypothetical protein